jgi:pimeloyl-ACP methyl ester carboxylesterase
MYADFRWPNWAQTSDLNLEVLSERPPAGVTPRPTPIVFAHGAFMGAWSWQAHFLDYFARQGFHAVAPSFRGHGQSEGFDRLDSASINDYVNDLEGVIGELGGPPPILVGHSMGALVAQRYMERAPVAGTVLMAPVPPHGLMPSTLRMLAGDPLLYLQFGMMQFFGPAAMNTDVAQRAVFSQSPDRPDMSGYAAQVQRESQRALWDMTVHARGRPTLARRHGPMHVIAGGDDALFTAQETRAVAQLWDASWAVVPSLAHALMIEPGWQQAADSLIGWLDQHGLA